MSHPCSPLSTVHITHLFLGVHRHRALWPGVRFHVVNAGRCEVFFGDGWFVQSLEYEQRGAVSPLQKTSWEGEKGSCDRRQHVAQVKMYGERPLTNQTSVRN